MILTYNDKKTKELKVIKNINSIDFSCDKKEIRLGFLSEEAIFLRIKDIHILSIERF